MQIGVTHLLPQWTAVRHTCYSSVENILLGCYCGVKMVWLWCYTYFTVVLLWFYSSVQIEATRLVPQLKAIR